MAEQPEVGHEALPRLGPRHLDHASRPIGQLQPVHLRDAARTQTLAHGIDRSLCEALAPEQLAHFDLRGLASPAYPRGSGPASRAQRGRGSGLPAPTAPAQTWGSTSSAADPVREEVGLELRAGGEGADEPSEVVRLNELYQAPKLCRVGDKLCEHHREGRSRVERVSYSPAYRRVDGVDDVLHRPRDGADDAEDVTKREVHYTRGPPDERVHFSHLGRPGSHVDHVDPLLSFDVRPSGTRVCMR